MDKLINFGKQYLSLDLLVAKFAAIDFTRLFKDGVIEFGRLFNELTSLIQIMADKFAATSYIRSITNVVLKIAKDIAD